MGFFHDREHIDLLWRRPMQVYRMPPVWELRRSNHCPRGSRIDTYQVQNLSLGNEVMESVHQLGDRGVVVPPVDVKDVDICGTELLQAVVQTDGHAFDVVTEVVDANGDIRVCTLVESRVLVVSDSQLTVVVRLFTSPTFVEITNWLRIPLCSTHSPMNCSDVSSWLYSLMPQNTRINGTRFTH